jgi:hypothetical protein
MAYQFSSNLSMMNANALYLSNVALQYRDRYDPTSVYEAHAELELRAGSGAPTPFAEFGRYTLVIRNTPDPDGQGVYARDTKSDLLRVRTAAEWIPRANIAERLIIVRDALATPTGLTTFLAALGAGTTQGQLNAGLTALKNLGVIEQATLAGTAP